MEMSETAATTVRMCNEPQGLMHYNCNRICQTAHANAFKACGFDTTPSPHVEFHGVHVISGPHFAYEQWKDSTPLMIDRAWWGDPDNVAIFWLMPDGTRRYATGTKPRPKPEMAEWNTGDSSCLILADYGQDTTAIEVFAKTRFERVTVRKHPAEQKGNEPLKESLMSTDVVIGHSTTALFESIKEGIPTICTDPLNECAPACSSWVNGELFRGDRTEWLHSMSYKQFTLDEIADGTAWGLLENVL